MSMEEASISISKIQPQIPTSLFPVVFLLESTIACLQFEILCCTLRSFPSFQIGQYRSMIRSFESQILASSRRIQERELPEYWRSYKSPSEKKVLKSPKFHTHKQIFVIRDGGSLPSPRREPKRNKATKQQVKDAFRKLAIKYHPDKHAQSPEHVRLNATVRFKLVSEAYEVLNDDLKRASYNSFSDSDCFRRTGGSYSNNPYGNNRSGYGYGYGYTVRNHSNNRFRSGFDSTFRYLTTRAFLLNLALVGGVYFAFTAIGTSGETLWKMRNSGKSFEEAMETIEKTKTHKDEG